MLYMGLDAVCLLEFGTIVPARLISESCDPKSESIIVGLRALFRRLRL